MAGVADNRASADDMHSSGVMLLLLKSLGMLWAWNFPPDGSEKHPRDVKPWIAEAVEVIIDAVEVEVDMVDVDVVMVAVLNVVSWIDDIWLELLVDEDEIEDLVEDTGPDGESGERFEPAGIESGPGVYFFWS